MWNPNNVTFRPACCNTTYNVPWYHKRKIEPDPEFDPSPPTKMLITEERMISQLNSIHLSQDYTTHGATPGPSTTEVEMDDTLNILGDRLNASSLPTLVVSDEIKELQNPIASPLPKHLLDNFKRQSQALVLWKPPAGELGKYLMSLRNTANTPNKEKEIQQQSTDVDMEDDDNNNGSTNQNLNGFFTRTV